jgi:hypothetical protein
MNYSERELHGPLDVYKGYKIQITERIMKKALLVIAFLIMAGCGGFTGRQSTIIEVSEREEVKSCLFLKSFQGPSSYRFWGPPTVIGNFKNEAIQKAETIGATHILWRTVNTGLCETAFIDAYKCPPSDVTKSDEEEIREE